MKRHLHISCLLLILLAGKVAAQNLQKCQSEYSLEHTYGNNSPSGTASFFDFNYDGKDDICLASSAGAKSQFLLNKEGGFANVDINIGDAEVKQILWGDYDKDGDADLFIAMFGAPNQFFNNLGDSIFIDVSEQIGIIQNDGPTIGSTWGDINNDGWIDLLTLDYYLNNRDSKQVAYVYLNDQNGKLIQTDVGIDLIGRSSFCASFFDYDNDGDEDLYIANDFHTGNVLYQNQGDGSFIDVSVEAGAGLEMAGMSVTIGDYDNNGYPDIYITNITSGNKLLKNSGDGTFLEVAEASGVAFNGVAWGAQFLDFDHDLDEDLYVSGMIYSSSDNVFSKLYENNADGTFSEKPLLDINQSSSYSNSIGDVNGDGFYDILVNNQSPDNSDLWCNTTNENNWLKLRLRGNESNSDAFGVKIEFQIQGTTYVKYVLASSGFLGQNSQYPIISMAEHTLLESLEIYWPTGTIDRYQNLECCRTMEIHEGETIYPPRVYVSSSQCSNQITVKTGIYDNYLWSNGSENQETEFAAGDEIFVTVWNNGDEPHSSEKITYPENPSTEIFKTNPTCTGATDGTISIEPNFEFTKIIWQDLEVGNQRTGLAEGTYIYTIMANSGCTISGRVKLSDPDSLKASFSTVRAKEKYIVNLEVSGGAPPYSYFLEDAEVTLPLELPGGEHTIKIIDSRNCLYTKEIFLEEIILAMTEGNESVFFPNPAFDEVQFTYLNLEVVSLVSLDGTVVYTTKLDENKTLNLKNLPKAMYLVFGKFSDNTIPLGKLLKE